VLQRHEQGDGIVRGGVGVDEELTGSHVTNLGHQIVSRYTFASCVTNVTRVSASNAKCPELMTQGPIGALPFDPSTPPTGFPAHAEYGTPSSLIST
jgi:hypothetical protein